MGERIVVVLLVATALFATARLIGMWRRRRLRSIAASPVLPELQPLLRPDRPTVLAFSTPGCVECRSLQRPALQQLTATLGDSIHVAQLSVPEHPTLVSHFGILTVPATVILDKAGAVRHVNLRYTDAERLQSQLQEIGAGL